MKPRVGLAISVGLNLGLVGVLIWLWLHPPSGQPAPADDLSVLGMDEDGTNNGVQIRYVSRPRFQFPTNALGRFTWRAIESPDYRRYIANLRAIRCPERTIRDIIVADVNELYAGQWKELLTQHAAEFRYWKTGDSLPGYPDETLERKAQELDAERKGLLKELLDVDAKDSLMQLATVNPMELTLGFLETEKRRQVIALQEEHARAQAALLAAASEDADIGAALQNLRTQHEERLRALLTPEEMKRYEMTTSPLAMALRSELSGFEPTEEEFIKIYEARKAQEEEVEATRVFLGAQIQAQEAQEAADQEARQREAANNAALLEQLGSERYAQLKRDADPNYDLLMQVSRATQFPPAVAARIYEYQQIAEVAGNRVRANSSLSLEEREVALNGIRAETERTIREAMGDSGLQIFREWNEQQNLRLAAPGVP